MDIYRRLRPLIYRLTPEQAHRSTVFMLRLGGALAPWLIRALFPVRHPGPEVQAFGITFPNPLGMAAGYDKDATAWRGLAQLGFGHIELGTVTPRPQPGNPPPRIFRLVEDEAVINRMGFPNRGADYLARQLRGKRPPGLVLGMNIGKNKTTPLEEAAADYLALQEVFAPLVDYLAVNVSSPNTPGLRSLQTRQALEAILLPLAQRRDAAAIGSRRVPVLVKLAPDLSNAELDDALEAILAARMDGVIIGNTTLQRPAELRSRLAGETGGLSGAPLRPITNAILAQTVARLAGRLPVIASGGVLSTADAREKLDLGACLVQLYTGLIYEGPGLVSRILNEGWKP